MQKAFQPLALGALWAARLGSVAGPKRAKNSLEGRPAIKFGAES